MNSNFLVKLIADDILIFTILAGAIALLFAVPSKLRWGIYARIIMAGLTALLIAKFMAAVYQPEASRPFQILGVDPGAAYIDNPGFPSDHVLLSFSVLYAVWFGVKRRWIVGLIAIAVLLVCVGRVLALVHTPLDIVGGILAATMGALWYIDWDVTKSRKKSNDLQKH